MNEFLAKAADHFTLALAGLMHAESAPRAPRSLEAKALLERADFFTPEVAPAELVFSGEVDFTFRSPVPADEAANRTVHGRLFRAGSSLAARPAVVLVHGWNDEVGYHLRQPAIARELNARGLHCVMLELPYHMHRRPKAPPAIRDFISGDLAAMIGATHRAIAEHRAVFGFLEKAGCSRTGLWGYSLGGWLAGLLACHDSRVDSLVIGTPMCDIRATVENLGFCRSVRESLRREPLDISALNLTSHMPLVPLDRMLLYVGEHDRFIPADSLEALWQAWGRPERRIEPHSHMTILAPRRILHATEDWLERKLIRRG